ncbi:hypothetical protein CPC08DRAFT_655355 [Agrocybe pediades]|nr:hypothetical protein CPC08DRAFT_655355 [Agrocybe pediades]
MSSQHSASNSQDFSGPYGVLQPPRSGKTTFSDMYEHNHLQTFSFGAASSSSSSSLVSPIDPLSRPRDDADSEELSLAPDTTPRPSMVGSQPARSPNSQLLQSLHAHNFDRREREQDEGYNGVSGNSSASASVSSFSKPSASNSRATSRVSRRSSTTQQTSPSDLTSDDEEESLGRHPLPPEPREALQDSHSRGTPMYLSEEDSDGYSEDYENDIEIDSVVHECTSDSGTFFDFTNPSRDSINIDNAGRRGSLAMPIPGAISHDSRHSRDYDYSNISNSRRPSRSLEDLHSFSFSQNSSTSHRADEPGAPTSVPESEGDWINLRKRSTQIQKEKDIPTAVTVNSSSTAIASNSSTSTNSENVSAADDFDTSWLQPYGLSGVVGFDLSEMADIVGESSNLNGHRPSFYGMRKTSVTSTRRQSTVSSQIDIMHKNINTLWATRKHVEEAPMWWFKQEKVTTAEENPYSRRHGQDKDKDKVRPSISTLFGPRPSSTTDHHTNSFTGSSSIFDKVENKDKDRSHEKGKEKSSKEAWKGMSLDSEEIWYNGSTGRFRVTRKNTASAEQGRPPQQRININYLRTPKSNGHGREPIDGPSATIHKHSKAAAFSIGRHYRARPANPAPGSPRHATTTQGLSSRDSADGKKRSSMILLGTRKVQKAYTSTNTTRLLESHGLLDDDEHSHSKDAERQRRQERDKRAKHREREKERKERKTNVEKGHPAESSRSKEKDKTKSSSSPSQPAPESSEGSSVGSDVNALSSGDSGTLISMTAVTTPESYSGSGSSAGSIEPSILSHETTSSDRTARAHEHRMAMQQTAQRRVPHVFDADGDNDEYDSDDELSKPITRTSHREAYAAWAPGGYENAHQESTSRGIFSGFAKSITGDRSGPRSKLDKPYDPPWPVTQPRHDSETRKYIVNDLNVSFQDVGLLPTTGEIKLSSSRNGPPKRKHDRRSAQKSRKRESETDEVDIFEDVPEDALYMLIPLWPGETDPLCARKYPYTPSPIPISARQYLLLYFKTPPPPPSILEDNGKGKSVDKKKKGSQDSQNASHEADKHVLLSSFHVTSRVFSHRDLQGSGVRIPDVGLAVSGPLKEAYEYLPDKCMRKEDIVLANCHSRSSGIEFFSEGFDKIGLTRPMLNPRPLEPNEDDDNSSNDTVPVLTPIGRAVMEMAWFGCLAVTSFNANMNA